MPDHSDFDVVILGGGAAGLMAALTAGQRGKRVAVLEVSNKLGKKILMSGGGRCNFTNLDVSAENFICANPHFVKSALAQYSNWDFIALVAKHEVPYHEKDHGQLFCDRSAKDILKILVDECQAVGVDLRLNCDVLSVSHEQGFCVSSNQGDFTATSLIVATGGLSIPTLGGATGFAYRLAEQFDLVVHATDASLVPMMLTGKWQDFAAGLPGVSLPAYVSVPSKGFAESLLFTHRGLSGPSILQLSNYWRLGEPIEIDLCPSVDIAQTLRELKLAAGNKTIAGVLAKYFPKSLLNAMQLEWWSPLTGKSLSEIKNDDLDVVGKKINHWQITPSGTEGYRTAEVTRGGISVDGVSSKTMQCQQQTGLFFIGEALDVTGHLGGFNFQWAWSSGYVAGLNA